MKITSTMFGEHKFTDVTIDNVEVCFMYRNDVPMAWADNLTTGECGSFDRKDAEVIFALWIFLAFVSGR